MMSHMMFVGIRPIDGKPEFGPIDFQEPTKADFERGKDEEDPYTCPCPFCGSDYTQVRWIGFFGNASGFLPGFMGECCDCQATTRACRTKKEAASWWNMRPVPASDDMTINVASNNEEHGRDAT